MSSVYSGVGQYYCTLQFAEYKRPKPFDNTEFNQVGTKYILPLPLQMFDNVGVDYSTTNLETVGDLINMTTSEPAGAAASVVGGVGLRMFGGAAMTGLNALGSLAGRAGPIGGVVGRAVGDIFTADRLNSALQSIIGYAPNPNQTVTFNGPRLREFNFSWTFLPQSREESINLANFIRECKMRSLPTSQFGLNAGVLKYPHMVRMNFFPWDKGGESHHYGWTEDSFIRMKRCVIERIAVNYAPSNIPSFFEGTKQPVATQVEITLKELEYMMSEDFSPTGRPAASQLDGALNTIYQMFTNPVGAAASGGNLPGELGNLGWNTPTSNTTTSNAQTPSTDLETAIASENGGQ